MNAEVGDEIVVEPPVVGAVERHGEVIEVLGHGAQEHYKVRWHDGHESTLFPGSDTHVRRR